MSDEIGTQPTAEAGVPQDPGTAPETSVQTGTSVAQPERTYTRKDVDAAYAEARRWAKEEEKRIEQRIKQDYEARQPKSDPDPADAYLQQVIDARMRDALAPLQAKEAERDLDSAISALKGQYKDFSENAVLQSFLDLGLDRATHIPIRTALEMAYRQSVQIPDVEKIRREAADEAVKNYTKQKVTTSSKTPKPETTGGQGAVGKRDITSRRDFDAALEASLARIE